MSEIDNIAGTAEEEYEVESIQDHRIEGKGKKKVIRYFIKWANYPEEDNTWEKENNLHAEELLRVYWSKFPKSNPDRLLFEKHQEKSENPIRLNSPPPPRVATVITASSPSPPSSPTLKPNDPITLTTTTTAAPVPVATSGRNIFTNFFSRIPHVTTTYASSSIASPAPQQPKQTNLTSVFNPNSEVDVSLSYQEGGLRKGTDKEGTVVIKPKVINNESSDSDSEDEYDDAQAIRESSDEVQIVKETHRSVEDNRKTTNNDDELRKRTRSTYTDYFTEQYNRKKKRTSRGGDIELSDELEVEVEEEEEEEEEDEIEEDEEEEKEREESLATSEDDFVDQKGADTIIFDEAFDKNPQINWHEDAEKVEYIGREVKGGPIYCAVKWKDDVRTFHSIDLVRTKRPDLVIDAFLKLVYP